VASIEEIGKSVQAFEGLGKNLKDPAIQQRLKLSFEDHSQKVTYAFIPWLQIVSNLRENVMEFTNIIVAIQFGREAAMYTDINAEQVAVTTPDMQVRERMAHDCVRLAKAVMKHATPYAMQEQPRPTSRAHDALFSMKPSIYSRIMNTEGFWWFHISRMEQGSSAFDVNVIEYNQIYLGKGIKFKA